MARTFLFGIDVGTSSSKVILIDSFGSVVDLASRNHPTHTPALGFQEQDSNDWWTGVCEASLEVINRTGINPADIAGVSLSGQGCACLPVDRQGKPLTNASIWTDSRASNQQRNLREIFGSDLGPITGNEIYDQPEPRMMWLRENKPEIYNQAGCFLTTVSYLIFRLTGKFGANYSDWGFHLSFDRKVNDWNHEFLTAAGLSSEKFPELYAPHAVIGTVTAEAASQCGLLKGTPVVAGGQDATVAALAVGAVKKGQSVFMRGTTDLMSFYTDNPEYNPNLYTTCAVLPGLFMSYDMKEVIASGGSFKWLAGIFNNEKFEFDEMNRLADSVPAGCNGVIFLPYLLISTAHEPEKERAGLFFNLSVSTKRGELCRAVLEGTAYALRETIERIKDIGIDFAEIRPTGGPTRSRLWNQITTDVTMLPLLLPVISEGAAYGAALLAGLGVGVFPMDDGYEALQNIVRLEVRYDPQPDDEKVYNRMYGMFKKLAIATSGITPELRKVS